MKLKLRKFKFFHQLESVDCGPACLAMVCSHHGLKTDLQIIKKMCAITRMGVSVQDIVNGAKKIGFESFAVNITPDQLDEIPLPAVLFWKQEHFVVLHKIKGTKGKKKYFLADPGYGKITVDEEILKKEWAGNKENGYVVLIDTEDASTLKVPPSEDNRKKKKEYYETLFSYLKKNKTRYILSFCLLVIGLVTNWAMPIIFQKILDEGIIARSMQVVWTLLGIQCVFFISNFISDFISEKALTKVNFFLSLALKEQFLRKLMKLPISYFDTRVNTDTLERLSDQEKVKEFITWKGLGLVLNIFNLVVFSVMLYYLNVNIFLIYLGLTLLSIGWIALFLKMRAIVEYSMFLRQSENSNVQYEFIMNMPEIKVNNAQNKVINNILNVQEKLNKLELRSLYLNMYQLLGVEFFTKLKEILTIAFCGYYIIYEDMTIGGLLAITYILGQLQGPINNLISFIKETQEVKIAQDRLFDVFTEEDENSEENVKIEKFPIQVKNIEVKNISFKYPGSFNPFVLENISFPFEINKITAIVGQSGSGKTTLLKLLLRYHKVNQGGIYLNGENLNDYNSDQWRDMCGVVSQDGEMFSGTIAQNIALSDENFDLEKIRKAAKIACADEFIENLPMQYNTKIGNIGMALSGGQKQRVLIARAVYRNPNFIFFDEATSSLDANNEKKIMNNLEEFFKGKTVFIIAHRLSTVKSADTILVLDKGVIIEKGNHIELVKKRGDYFELVRNQLELGN